MSLRCSLLGHTYGDATTEREREEQGSEVVVTVRTFEECQRCGERKIVSENKEVTSIESPAPDLESVEADQSVDVDPDANATTDAEVTAAGGDDAEILDGSVDEDPNAARDAPSSSPDSGAGSSAGTTSPAAADDLERSAADDDGVILEDDGDASGEDGRQHGEWPEAETTHPAEADEGGHAPWPDVGREDEGFDAEPADGTSADVEFGGGLTPESASGIDEDDEVEFVNAAGDALRTRDTGGGRTELSSGISAGAEAPSLSGPADDPDLDAEFVCPECDYREGVAGSSLRAGDICPECGRGYLAQE